MSAKYDAFIKELKDLCDKHEVMLSTEGYDQMQVWDRGRHRSDSTAFYNNVDPEDCTNE